ncbi:chloride channel protein 2-like isoform X3, partial [Leptotrombidium deliense]
MSYGLEYEDSVIFGKYHDRLADFARNEAQKQKESEAITTTPTKPAQRAALLRYYITLNGILGDWPFVVSLSLVVSLLGFSVDMTQEIVLLNYFVWIIYNVVLVLIAATIVRYSSPHTAGAGLAEVKVVVRGVVINEYLAFSTLVSKLVGLPLVLATNLGVGKEVGPFIHISSMVMYQLFQPYNFLSSKTEFNVRFQELVAISASVGVASSFASPIGGVLFSVEIIRSFFAVNSYVQAFIAATIAAFMYRLYFVLVASEKLQTHIFITHFRETDPYEPAEVILFAFLGIMCGFLAWLFIFLLRQMIQFLRNTKSVHDFLFKYPFVYPFTAAFLIATFKYKLFIGKYTSTWLPVDNALHSLYANFTWNSNGFNIDGNINSTYILNNWSTSSTSLYTNALFFFISYFFTTLVATTVYVPGGLVVPLFLTGGAFGRFYGEIISSFLNTFYESSSNRTIVVGAYAVASSAALCGSVTGSLATTVIAAELTGQLTHFIPIIICVASAHLCARNLGPSIFDSIIKMKDLPFIPSVIRNSPEAYDILVEEFMETDVPFVWSECTYEYLRDVLETNLARYPYVHSPLKKYLLGTIRVHELKNLLDDQLTENESEKVETDATEDAKKKEEKFKAKLHAIVNFESCHIDAAPLQVMEGTPLINNQWKMTKGQTDSELEYENTVIFGRYHEALADFARSEAEKIKVKSRNFANFVKYVTIGGLLGDWPLLMTLAVIVATLSILVDFGVNVLHIVQHWLLKQYEDNFINYVIWTCFSVSIVSFCVVIVRNVSPQAGGSGLAEIKVIIRGVILKEYLSMRTLFVKTTLLPLVIASGFGLGKEVTFIHSYSSAVGVAAAFAAPVGAVLYSVEIVKSFFAVRSYFEAFLSATFAALLYRFLYVVFAAENGITYMFPTKFRNDHPYETVEIIAFMLLGVLCGLFSWFFVTLQRQIVQFSRGTTVVHDFLEHYPIIYPIVISFLIASTKYKQFFGQYSSAWLTMEQSLTDLYSNFTWDSHKRINITNITNLQAEEEAILNRWTTSSTSIYSNTFLFFATNLIITTFASTIAVPGGIMVPMFVVGAGFGRYYGENLANLLRLLGSTRIESNLIVGAYAVAGSAALCGAATGSLATAVIAFEITGQLTHFIPIILCVICANILARNLGPTIYENIIHMKNLPYLPAMIKNTPEAYRILVEEFMDKQIRFVWRGCKYSDIQNILKEKSKVMRFPFVHSPETKYLLGTIHTLELTNLLEKHLQANKDDPDNLSEVVNFEMVRIDAAPLQVMEGTPLVNIHNLFSLLSLQVIYVTSLGRVTGVVTLKK